MLDARYNGLISRNPINSVPRKIASRIEPPLPEIGAPGWVEGRSGTGAYSVRSIYGTDTASWEKTLDQTPQPRVYSHIPWRNRDPRLAGLLFLFIG
jgi:hypothetical protein